MDRVSLLRGEGIQRQVQSNSTLSGEMHSVSGEPVPKTREDLRFENLLHNLQKRQIDGQGEHAAPEGQDGSQGVDEKGEKGWNTISIEKLEDLAKRVDALQFAAAIHQRIVELLHERVKNLEAKIDPMANFGK
jgi:hypothetical protein